jgi:prophage DNA circulation protein
LIGDAEKHVGGGEIGFHSSHRSGFGAQDPVRAAVSVLQALVAIAFFLGAVGAVLLYRRVLYVIGGIEERQVAPAVARVNAILDDIKDVTSTVKEDATRIERVVSRVINSVRRFRRKADADPRNL